ncbi:hypothetical protein B0A50_02135 [Salinomyces thailandicus]|uniref:Mitochondrial inner membrane protease ATP23 n=1 Tax=Salinomyces thailandicus TaxID=706561 RepID=A0A4U0U7R1_9PEZI|nr:hypothetical protein B0A50_02135 [Salinomyces thailandica]
MAEPPLSADPSASTSASASPAPDHDPAFYTWSTFFSILTNTAPPTTRNAYFNHKDTLNEAADCARCEASKTWLFAYSPTIRFLRHHLDLLVTDPSAASITPENVRCRRCTTNQSGGFSPEHGILLCANHLRNRGHLEDTLAHEMVHAHDHLRFKLDPEDLRHAACMEIRASTLSGESVAGVREKAGSAECGQPSGL